MESLRPKPFTPLLGRHPANKGSGYGRRWKKWLAIYVVAGVVVYLIVYLAFFYNGGGGAAGGGGGLY